MQIYLCDSVSIVYRCVSVCICLCDSVCSIQMCERLCDCVAVCNLHMCECMCVCSCLRDGLYNIQMSECMSKRSNTHFEQCYSYSESKQ